MPKEASTCNLAGEPVAEACKGRIWSSRRDNRGKQFDAPDKNRDILCADMTKGIVRSFGALVQVVLSRKFESGEYKDIKSGLEGN